MSTRGPDCVKMMCQGNIFYIYTSTSRAPVTIFFVPNTPDNLGSFYWCRVGELVRHEQCKFPLSILTDVIMGKQTPSFQRPHAAQARSEHCMSLVSTMLTLDLEAVSEQVVCDWIDGLTYILSVEGEKALVDDQPAAQATSTPQPPSVTSTTGQRGPPPPPGANTKRRFTVHGSGGEDANAAAAAAAAAQQPNDDDETITGHTPLSDSLSEREDPLFVKAQQTARQQQSEDGLTTLQRGGIVVHYRLNKPPQIAYICHHTKPEQLLGSLSLVPLAPVNNFTNNPTLSYSGYDARLLLQELKPDALHLLRSIAIGDTIKTKQVAQDFQEMTNNSMAILTTGAPPPPPLPGVPGGISAALQSSMSSTGGFSGSASFNVSGSAVGGGAGPAASTAGNVTTVCLDSMSDLFLGSTHQDFLSAKQCDPSAALSIITDNGSFSIEATDKYILSLWITDLQNLLTSCGTDVVAAEEDLAEQEQQQALLDEQKQHEATLAAAAALAEQQKHSPMGPPTTAPANRNRRFTVTRTDMPTSALPAAAAAAARAEAIQEHTNPSGTDIDPLDIAFRTTGLEFVQFPGAIPCILTVTGATGSPGRQLVLSDKFKKTLIDSVVLTELTQVTQGTAHTKILATCGQPTLALTLAFKSSVTGGTNTWYLTAANIETYNVFACGLTQYLYHQNRSLKLTQHVPSRVFTTQIGLHPHQEVFKRNNTSSLMMSMSVNDQVIDEFQADLPSLIAMLTQGRIFTGFAERENDIVMNKLTLFFMSPQELLSIASMDPKKAQDPTRAAKLKTNVGPIDPNTKGRLCWCTAGRRVPMQDSFLELDSITDIFVGKQTKVLDDHAAMFPRERCFTIMAANDQLDLVTENGLQLLSWMRALHHLCGMTTANNETNTGSGLQEIEIDKSDHRLASTARGKRFSVSGGQGGANTANNNVVSMSNNPDKKKRLSLLITNQTPTPPKPLKDNTLDVKDPRMTLGRGARFVRCFTSHGTIKTQQVWVYHTSSSDSSDPSKRAGSLRWVPLGILAETLGMAGTDPNPNPNGTGPTAWLSQLDRYMSSIPISQLEETIKVVNQRDREALHGAWGVIRLAHITDVYVGRTTASLKTLVPPEQHLECFSIVSRDSNKQQSVLSLRADEETIITHWLECIQNLILTGGKKLTSEPTSATPSAPSTSTTGATTTDDGANKPQSGRRFTVTGGDGDQAAAAAAAAAAQPPSDEQDPSSPQPSGAPRARRLTVKSNQGPPPIVPAILQTETENKPKQQGRRFTVTKQQQDEAAAAIAAAGANSGTTTPKTIEPAAAPTVVPPPLPGTKSPPPLPGARTLTPEADKAPVVVTPTPEPIKEEPKPVLEIAKSPMPQVAPDIWAKLVQNDGVKALLQGIEVTVYTTPKDEEFCSFTSVIQNGSTAKDIGVVTNQGRVYAKKALLYFSPYGGKSGSVFIHTPNGDETVNADMYQQMVSVYEYTKFANELNIECMPVHTLTDITIGKSDPMWKLITAGDSKPFDPAVPTNVISSSSTCLSLTSKFKVNALLQNPTAGTVTPSSPEAIANAQQNGGKIRKQLHLTTKHKSIVQQLVQALQYVIAQTGKKVLYDQQPAAAAAPKDITPTSTPATPSNLTSPSTTTLPASTTNNTNQQQQQQYHDIADLLQGHTFTQYVRAGVGVKQFKVVISLHKSTQVMFTQFSTNQDCMKSNLGRTHELAPTVRSFDLHSSTSSSPDRSQHAMPNVAPVTAQDITWRGLVESSGLGFFCVKDVTKDSKVWLPLGALTDVYLGQSANVPSNARTPNSMYTLTFSLTGGSSYHLILSSENEEAGKNWLLHQINGSDGGDDDEQGGDNSLTAVDAATQAVLNEAPALVSTGDAQLDEIVAYMSKKHLMFVYANVTGRLCRLRSYVWYDPQLHAILWSTTDVNARQPMYACPIPQHCDVPSTSPLPPPRAPSSPCRCTPQCKRPLHNVLHLSAVNEVFVGRMESLLKLSTTDNALSQLKIDEDSCATVTADKLDLQGQPLPTTPDWEAFNKQVELNIEASTANYLEEWLNGLQHLLQLRGANVIYS